MAKKGTKRRKTFYIDLDIHRNPTGKTLAKPIKCITTGFLVYTKIEEYRFFDEQTITRHQKLRYKSKTETKPYIGPSGDVEIGAKFSFSRQHRGSDGTEWQLWITPSKLSKYECNVEDIQNLL